MYCEYILLSTYGQNSQLLPKIKHQAFKVSKCNPLPFRQEWFPTWPASCSQGCPPSPASPLHTPHPVAATFCNKKKTIFRQCKNKKPLSLLFETSPIFIKNSHLSNVGLGDLILLSVG